MIRCTNCGNDNLDASEFCDECGVKLPSGGANGSSGPQEVIEDQTIEGVWEAVSDSALRDAALPLPSFTTSNSQAKPAVPYQPPAPVSVPAPSAVPAIPPEPARRATTSTRSGEQMKSHAKLLITRGSSVGTEFALVGRESNIGRWDADNGVFPDIDLDRFDPEAKISRRHARIILDDGQYLVEDLGSTNGTFINRGRRLIPGSRHPLHSGDELILGKTFLKFLIEN